MAPALGLARYLSCKALDRACCSLNAFNILGSGFASRQRFFSGSDVPDMERLCGQRQGEGGLEQVLLVKKLG